MEYSDYVDWLTEMKSQNKNIVQVVSLTDVDDASQVKHFCKFVTPEELIPDRVMSDSPLWNARYKRVDAYQVTAKVKHFGKYAKYVFMAIEKESA
jgi:hypothetical protein